MNSFLKKLIIPALASKPISSLATLMFGRGIPVFMLHRMMDKNQYHKGTTAEHLRECLGYLKKHHYTFISLNQLIKSLTSGTPLPIKPVIFTIDDGFLDQAKIAIPIFIEYDCPVTFFVITEMLNQTLWPWDAQVSWIVDNTDKKSIKLALHDETLDIITEKNNRREAREIARNRLKEVAAKDIFNVIQQLAKEAEVTLPIDPPDSYKPFNWDDAREMENQGITFSPHSMSHQILSKLDRESCLQEILGSWETLEKELKKPLKVFCYPTGRALDFGPREINILKQANFIGAVATTPGYISTQQNYEQQIFRIPRFELPDNMLDFIQYCSWIERAKYPRK